MSNHQSEDFKTPYYEVTPRRNGPTYMMREDDIIREYGEVIFEFDERVSGPHYSTPKES